MLRIELRFCAGRYHATPWGRHVNEGATEWPPSPWRIGRALLATGFAKAGWSEVPETAGYLVMRLASTPPIYYLPPATAAHTRHYMPTPKGHRMVIDAFAYPGRGGVMLIEWNLAVTDAECALLDSLLARMAYLGRAESWIEAQRVERVPCGLSRCAPGDDPPGPAWERLELMALMPEDEYAAWHEHIHQRESERRLERTRERARELGKRRPRTLSKILRARLEAELPATCIDALCADTAELRRAGWNRPPGARWLTYWRPSDALDARPAMRRARVNSAGLSSEPHRVAVFSEPYRVAVPSEPHRVAVLAFVASARAPRLPLLRDALPRCEALHRALVSQSAELHPEGKPTLCFAGRDDHCTPLQGHRHTTLMPLALGGRGRLDQVVLYTPMGLDAHAVAALQGLRVLQGNDPPLGVLVTGLGQPEHFAGRIPALGTARVWESCTPFVPPRYLKVSGKNLLAGQVRAELAGRGLPEPLAVEIQVATSEGIRYVDGVEFWAVWKGRRAGMHLAERWRMYKRVRRGAAPKPPIAVAFGLRITFAEPIRGPVSLGYGSHFGLGLFTPSV